MKKYTKRDLMGLDFGENIIDVIGEKVLLVHIFADEDPDTSWMEEEQIRLYEAGLLTFHGVGAEIRTPIAARSGDGEEVSVSSMGLWGIDFLNDTDESRRDSWEYLKEIALEEIEAVMNL